MSGAHYTEDLTGDRIVIVKFKLYSFSSEMHALGVIVYDKLDDEVKRSSFAAGTKLNVPPNLEGSWLELEERIMTDRTLGNTVAQISKKGNELIKEMIPQTEFSQPLVSGSDDEVKKVIQRIFAAALGSAQSTDIVFEREFVTQNDYLKPLGGDRSDQSKEQAPSAVLDDQSIAEIDEGVMLKCKFSVDPVKGRQLSHISPGDKIWMIVTDERDLARYLVQLLINAGKGSEDGLPATVVKKEERQDGRIKIQAEFGPGITGLAEGVPELLARSADEDDLSKRESAAVTGPIVAIVGIVILLMIFSVLMLLAT